MATVADSVMETRENIPLRKGQSKSSDWWYCSEDYLSGARFINIAFGVLTFIITVALLLQIYYGDYQVEPHGSVATDSIECSKIGTSILKKGGNSVDAAIASAFCTAVVVPHLTGLDAEGQMLIYNHKLKMTPDVVDFSGANVVSEHLPRLVLGLAYVHSQYASLEWKDLIQPSADLARRGFLIPKMLVEAIRDAGAEDLYGRLEPGQLLQLDTLAVTLERIASIPKDTLYLFITEDNRPNHAKAVKSTFKDHDIYVANAPTIGPLFLTNLAQIDKLNFSSEDAQSPEYAHKIAEVTQNVYKSLNISSLFHQGTSSNIAVMDKDDSYVSLTTGLFTLFGSGEMTSAGYIPDAKGTKTVPCSRLSLIAVDTYAICGRRLIFGANDVAVASQIILSLLVSKENVTNSIEAPRFHLLNNGSIGIEGLHTPFFNEDALKYLETLTTNPVLIPEPYPSSNIVEKFKDDLNSHSDSRGGGIASRF